MPTGYFLTKPADAGQLLVLVAAVRGFGLAIVRPADDRAAPRELVVRASAAARGANATAQAACAVARRDLRAAEAAYDPAYAALL